MRDIDGLVLLGARFSPGQGGDVALTPSRRDEVERELRLASPAPIEVAVLATCNRTELLVAGLDVPGAITLWHRALGSPTGPAPCLAAPVEPYVHTGREAVRHLCRVACGLDSAILGEVEIVGQLRDACRRAEAAGTAGPALRRAFRAAFAASKAARGTTAIGHAAPGVGSAVADLVAGSGRPGPAVVVGTGGAARSVVRQLVRRERPTVVLGRDPAAVDSVARRFGTGVGSIDELASSLQGAAAVVSTVPGPAPVVTSALRAAPAGLLVVDLAAPGVAKPPDRCRLVTLEQVADGARRVPSARCAAIPQVEAIIERVTR